MPYLPKFVRAILVLIIFPIVFLTYAIRLKKIPQKEFDALKHYYLFNTFS